MKATQTGVSISFIKAVGMLYPEEKRIFKDPYSEKLLPPIYKFLVILMRSPRIFNFFIKLREKLTPGLLGWLFCRFRYNTKIFKYVSRAAPNSKIVFSYILKSFIDGKNIHQGIKVMYKYMRKKNNPLWIYGLEPTDLGDYLAKYSLAPTEDIGSKEVKERYLKLVNQDLNVFEIERIALAEVKRS